MKSITTEKRGVYVYIVEQPSLIDGDGLYVRLAEIHREKHRKAGEENAEKPNKATPIIPAKSLDEMSVESKEKHLTYGQLQAAETIKRMRGES